jgi:hypothetical protein
MRQMRLKVREKTLKIQPVQHNSDQLNFYRRRSKGNLMSELDSYRGE